MIFVPLTIMGLASEPTEMSLSQKSLIRQLSMRDGSPSCESLSKGNDEFQRDLKIIVEHVTHPPWAGMRAASCVIELYPEQSLNTFEEWMTQENTMGLAYLLSSKLSEMPESIAIPVAEAGLSGPHSKGVLERIRLNQSPEIKALTEGDSE
jgi:hypothetical protein